MKKFKFKFKQIKLMLFMQLELLITLCIMGSTKVVFQFYISFLIRINISRSQ